MSSYTDRQSLSNNVNQAYALAKQIADNGAKTEIIGTKINVTGNDNLLNIDASSGSTQGTTLTQELDTNLTKGVTASTTSLSTSYTKVLGDVTTTSDATASATSTQTTKVSTETASYVLLGGVGLGIIGTVITGWLQYRSCKEQNKNSYDKNPNNVG
jgi:hypothetical protein